MSDIKGSVADTGFVVIGAGLPRTGTLSLKVALTQLLGGPYNDHKAAITSGTCYHMVDVMLLDGRNGKYKFWLKAAKGEVNKEEWVSFLEGRGYRAGVDYPLSFHWKELLEIFPNAKVVLSLRSEDTWYESCKNTIVHMVKHLRTFPCNVATYVTGISNAMQVPYTYGHKAVPSYSTMPLHDVIEAGHAESVAWFRQWNEEVKRTVPADRLLVHEAKQGWGPLCEFLGVPIPDHPYPRVNDTAEQLRNLRNVKILGYFIAFGVPVFLSSFTYMIFRLYGNSI